MRVFLTGGTGFIGKPLVGALRRRGWDVNVLVRQPDSLEARACAISGQACRPETSPSVN